MDFDDLNFEEEEEQVQVQEQEEEEEEEKLCLKSESSRSSSPLESLKPSSPLESLCPLESLSPKTPDFTLPEKIMSTADFTATSLFHIDIPEPPKNPTNKIEEIFQHQYGDYEYQKKYMMEQYQQKVQEQVVEVEQNNAVRAIRLLFQFIQVPINAEDSLGWFPFTIRQNVTRKPNF